MEQARFCHVPGKPILVCSFLLILGVGCQAPAQVDASPPRAKLPAFTELADGWNGIVPGGETSCAVTRDFRFYALRGDPTRLLLYLTGGGACWNGRDCDPNAERSAVYVSGRSEPRAGPVPRYPRAAQPENPFAGYSAVWVPACTGDVYLGDHDTTYTIANATVREMLSVLGATRERIRKEL